MFISATSPLDFSGVHVQVYLVHFKSFLFISLDYLICPSLTYEYNNLK